MSEGWWFGLFSVLVSWFVLSPVSCVHVHACQWAFFTLVLLLHCKQFHVWMFSQSSLVGVSYLISWNLEPMASHLGKATPPNGSVYVCNLPHGTDENMLSEYFGTIGLLKVWSYQVSASIILVNLLSLQLLGYISNSYKSWVLRPIEETKIFAQETYSFFKSKYTVGGAYIIIDLSASNVVNGLF